MSRKAYVVKRFTKQHQAVINRANVILNEYAAQGLVLTLRQLYYQFVARDYIPNTMKSYKRLGGIIGDARLAGQVDWEMLEDRTRNLSSLQHFDGPQDALNKLCSWYHVDMWANQKHRPEVWIEKEALAGVVSRVCQENDVPFFSCKGYTSLSEMWRASERLRYWFENGQTPYIIHFGDHDPSGIDMSRDIVERIRSTFMSECEFNRVALNMDQIEKYNPPPNPAKITDSRYQAYLKKFGNKSWELDALNPPEFRRIIESELAGIRDDKKWKEDATEKASVKSRLTALTGDWERLDEYRDRIPVLESEAVIREQKLESVSSDLDRVTKELTAARSELKKRKNK